MDGTSEAIVLGERAIVLFSGLQDVTAVRPHLNLGAAPRTLLQELAASLKPDPGRLPAFTVAAAGVTDGRPEILGIRHPDVTDVQDVSTGLALGFTTNAIVNFMLQTLGSIVRSNQDAIDFVGLVGYLHSLVYPDLGRNCTMAVARNGDRPVLVTEESINSTRARNQARLQFLQQRVVNWARWADQ